MIDEATVQRLLAAATEQGLPPQVTDEDALALAATLARRARPAA